ncbi:hypothetical protein BOO86_17810 [Mycobacterium sp. CBMA 234]|uniref:intersectin-EH binding protein Ibp1 n=1 Tax=Mycolicibacterium sp. CBMA 234 TaxID=1918495 RepID=UPI0012DC2E23|nr:intersectin-EH binding protein Ibp1 [Mycolicibacterium sp. CBMA 234]MUL66333.1 hypothetical protein [Mycolicibacterium sp. CBMA 234]
MAANPIFQRILIASGFVVATIAAPTVLALSSPSNTTLQLNTTCPPGMTLNALSGSCFTGGDQATEQVQAPSNALGWVDGIPCTGRNIGDCIGLQQNQVRVVQPHSTVSSSP